MLPAAYTWSLTAIAVAAAFAMLWAFGRCSDQAAIRLAKRKVHAHLLAFRLFADEPSQIFRSQGQLLVWNLRYLAQMLRPTAVTIIPLALLLFHLDAIYGRRSLEVGEATIVSARVADGVNLASLPMSLEGHGIAVETPPVRLPAENSVCWRVRATQRGNGSVDLNLSGAPAQKLVQAGTWAGYISDRRSSSAFAWLLYPREARLRGAEVTSISVDYPSARIGVFGFGMHWLVWFCLVSLFAMLAFRSRLHVTF